VGVRVDQSRRYQSAAEILDMIHIDNVLNDSRQTMRKLIRGTRPSNAIFAHQNYCIAPYFRTGPQPADIRQQSNAHWPASPSADRNSPVPAIAFMHPHLP